jgi:hypothetical protein
MSISVESMDATVIIKEWLSQKVQRKEYWTNDWLLLENGVWMQDESRPFEWQEPDEVFSIHFIRKPEGLYFKLLPLLVSYKDDYGVDGLFAVDDQVHEQFYKVATPGLVGRDVSFYVS